jgi:hypothetical protein
MPHEVAGVAPAGEKGAQRRVGIAGQQRPGPPVEHRHLSQGDQVTRTETALGEQPAAALRTGVFEAAALTGHRHAHLGGLRRHVQLGEELHQHRVRAPVVHDEPRVDGQRAHPVVDVVGVGVPAEARVGLVDGDVVRPAQHVRGGQPGHPGTDDSYGSHTRSSAGPG